MPVDMLKLGLSVQPRVPEDRAMATAQPRQREPPETSVEERAANKIEIALIVQRRDRPVGVLPAS
jgi:hypothetical protein